MNPDPVAAQAAGEIVAQMMLCQPLQSEKDGRERLLPVTMTRCATGAAMARRGDISLLPAEDHAQKALVWLTQQFLSTKDNNQ